jgi:hypothetical protein
VRRCSTICKQKMRSHKPGIVKGLLHGVQWKFSEASPGVCVKGVAWHGNACTRRNLASSRRAAGRASNLLVASLVYGHAGAVHAVPCIACRV